MKNKQTYLQMLIKQKIFSSINPEHIEIFHFKKGDYILKQGNSLDYLYILVDGSIKTCHTTANGLQNICAIVSDLYVLGELELLTNQVMINDIIALNNCTLLAISIHLYKEELFQDLSFMTYLAKSIATKLYNKNNNDAISINYSTKNRLASYLIAVAQNGIIKDDLGTISEIIGCSYRQLQRVFKEFIIKGYIKKIKRGEYQIIQFAPLEKLSKDIYFL